MKDGESCHAGKFHRPSAISVHLTYGDFDNLKNRSRIDRERSNKQLARTANYDAFISYCSAWTIFGMQLDDHDIREFTALWKEEFNETLTPDEARHYASQLLELYSLLAKPLPSEMSSHDAELP